MVLIKENGHAASSLVGPGIKDSAVQTQTSNGSQRSCWFTCFTRLVDIDEASKPGF